LGTSQAEAVRKFVDAIINDRMVIVLSFMDSKLTNAFPTDDPTYELESFKKYAATGESMELRYWSGKAYR